MKFAGPQIEKTLKCYIVESADAKAVREKAVGLENKMNGARNKLKPTYVEANGETTEATFTVLRTKIRSAAEESVRKSCWEATRTTGPFLLANGFPEIIAERNRFARTLGYEDFYDMKVTQAEGFNKKRCFEMLDGLEAATAPLLKTALEKLEKEKGADALKPWNLSYALSGELSRDLDPYFPFENAPEVWGRSFAAMGIAYRGTKMRLDLCDRAGKYPNGFCHWPVAPHRDADGTWHSSEANFTSLATPDEVGSGNTALTTLMHEGGHAAHFANIEQGSPLFAQERAPFSVSLAETQSMFLDSLCGDAAWLGRYARDRSGAPVPWALLERSIKEKHPYEVFALRGMIAVPYFEKALYEMPEEDLTAENIARVADEIEHKIQGGLAARPLLSGAFYTPVPIRPRSRGERRSLRTFAVVSLRPGSLAFDPRHRRLSTPPTDAFQLHPDVRSYGPSTLSAAHHERRELVLLPRLRLRRDGGASDARALSEKVRRRHCGQPEDRPGAPGVVLDARQRRAGLPQDGREPHRKAAVARRVGRVHGEGRAESVGG